MMGFDNQEESQLYASQAEMETLLLDDPSPSVASAAAGGSAHYSDPLSSSSLPFAEISTDDYDYPPSSSPSSNFHLPNPNPNPNLNSSSFHSILEPPSYADAVFRSFDKDQINGHDHNSLEQPSSSPRSEYIRISVSDPQKELELSNSLVPGSNTYYTYLVTTRTNLKEFGGSEFSVRRRFREVVSLSERLAETNRGFFIPLRPDKSVVESKVMQEGEFVEYRREALEKYLRRLAAHPVIKRSEEFRKFLQVEGKVFDGMGDSREVAVVQQAVGAKGGGGRDLLWMFKELKQSVSYDWGGTKPLVVEEDKEFMERKDRLQEFELQLSSVSQQVSLLCYPL